MSVDSLPQHDMALAPLQAGDRLALTSFINLPPRRFCDYGDIITTLAQRGFDVEDCTLQEDTKAKHAESFNISLRDDIRGLVPVASNRYAREIMGRLDYAAFAEHRPLLTTFSAGSGILALIQQRSGVPVFYGPNMSFIARYTEQGVNEFTTNSFWNLVMKTNSPIANTDDPDARAAFIWDDWNPTFRNIHAEGVASDEAHHRIPFVAESSTDENAHVSGKLLPIFLQSLARQAGTQHDIDTTDRIIMVESDQIPFEEAERYLRTLQAAGKFACAKALVIAGITHHPTHDAGNQLMHDLYDPKLVRNFVNSVRRMLGGDIPVTYGFPMGHAYYTYTLPVGIKADLDVTTGDVTLLESPFRTTNND